MSVVTDCLKDIYELLTVSELILNDYIFVKEVLKIINRLSDKKTAESERILNEVLKRIILKISADFMQKICITFLCNLLSTHYKELIIIIQCKKNKKNYLLLKSYRLITFKNMLAKVIKKILVTYISYTAEKYSLFF